MKTEFQPFKVMSGTDTIFNSRDHNPACLKLILTGTPNDEGTVPSPPAAAKELPLPARALALKLAKPDLTAAEIASMLECSRSALYKSPTFVAAMGITRESGKSLIPRGVKSKGRIEAWNETASGE